jgi:hypothetical protein
MPANMLITTLVHACSSSGLQPPATPVLLQITRNQDMAGIWRQVAEDFAPFDVDVTTEEPAADIPLHHWVRVAIGGTDCECVPPHLLVPLGYDIMHPSGVVAAS